MGSDLEFYLGIGGCLLFVLVVIYYGNIENKSDEKKLRNKMNDGTLEWKDFNKAYHNIVNKHLIDELHNFLEEKDKIERRDKEIILKRIENEKDEQNKILAEEFKKNKLYGADDRLKIILNEFGNLTNVCFECDGNKSRIWKLNEKIIELRCEFCENKMKYFNKDFESFEFASIINAIEDYRLLGDKRWENKYIKQISLVDTNDDYWKIKNHPKYSAFVIKNSLKNIKDTIEKSNRKISQAVKDKVWNRDRGKCVECGSNENLEFDHIIPHSKGGANTYRNIQLLCESCNRSKSNKIG